MSKMNINKVVRGSKNEGNNNSNNDNINTGNGIDNQSVGVSGIVTSTEIRYSRSTELNHGKIQKELPCHKSESKNKK